jgi:RHS repeat-associated protein
VFYYFSDHLKTASVITDSAGVIKAESDYYPWGGELQFVSNDSNDYKFTGKKRDTETGLDYFGARYYSNGLGRWVSADWSATPVPVPYADFGDPQSLNQYSYVRGLPTTKTDADGHGDAMTHYHQCQGSSSPSCAAANYKPTAKEAIAETVIMGAWFGGVLLAPEIIPDVAHALAGDDQGPRPPTNQPPAEQPPAEGSAPSSQPISPTDRVNTKDGDVGPAAGGKAPDQVQPGTKNLKGEYHPEDRPGSTEPYSAHYDEYGRQTGRTDHTSAPDATTHTDPHHHTREYGPGYGPKGKEDGPFPGEHPNDKEPPQ